MATKTFPVSFSVEEIILLRFLRKAEMVAGIHAAVTAGHLEPRQRTDYIVAQVNGRDYFNTLVRWNASDDQHDRAFRELPRHDLYELIGLLNRANFELLNDREVEFARLHGPSLLNKLTSLTSTHPIIGEGVSA